ncbi:MAG: DUF2480 family protein [Bacteroidota bacterium]|nr:DUF2480 family protein [Bacteroidota bacterium]
MEIVNRVAQSGIQVYDLELLWEDHPIKELDLASFLDHGILLQEKPFRAQVAAYDWQEFDGAHVALFCSTEALVPMWAYMLIASHLDRARTVATGRRADVVRELFAMALAKEDWSRFADRIVVIKGCGSGIVPESAYTRATTELQKVARKVMFGEPCSSVPVWRRPKERVE